MLTLPIGLALLASMLELYPLVKRLTVFLLSVLALPVALDWVCRWRGDLRVPGIGLAVAVLIPPSIYAALAVARPFPREELREVLEFVAEQARPGDSVCPQGDPFLPLLRSLDRSRELGRDRGGRRGGAEPRRPARGAPSGRRPPARVVRFFPMCARGRWMKNNC